MVYLQASEGLSRHPPFRPARRLRTSIMSPKRISAKEPPSRPKRPSGLPRRRKTLNQIIEHRLIKRVSFEEYREKVRNVYDGPQGAMLAACSMLSLHVPLGERLFRERKFDLRGARNILDVGSGAGQIARHLLKYADPQQQPDLLRFVARDAAAGEAPAAQRPPAICGGRPHPAPLSRRRSSTASLAATSWSTCRTRSSAWASSAGVMTPRGADAPVDHGGQFLRGLDQPSVVLPHLQSPRIGADLRESWAAATPGTVVHPHAQGPPRRRNLRGTNQGLSGRVPIGCLIFPASSRRPFAAPSVPGRDPRRARGKDFA